MFRLRPLAVCAVALATVAAPAVAADTAWKIDPGHSSAEFGIKHFAITTVKGTIPVKAGTIAIPAGKEIPSSIEATLDASAIDSKNERRDNDLKSPDFFDVQRYPTITFKSTKIDGTDPSKFTIVGELTMHGVTKPVTLEAHLEGNGTGARGEKRLGYSAVTTIHRRDFGLTNGTTNATGALVVGEDAQVTLDVEAIGQ
ncbi:MAG: YceI family protein [Candidatus Velthaea sp.]